MNIESKVQYIQITTNVKLEEESTSSAEETVEFLQKIRERLKEGEYTFEGTDLFSLKHVLPLKNEDGQEEQWIAKYADLQCVYNSKDLKVYDLDVSYFL